LAQAAVSGRRISICSVVRIVSRPPSAQPYPVLTVATMAASESILDRDLRRLQELIARGDLVHPVPDASDSKISFADMAYGLAVACDRAPEVPPAARGLEKVEAFLRDLRCGGVNCSAPEFPQHLVLILCDGMGNAVLDTHLREEKARGTSFLLRHNDPTRMRAVFPATTPAALSTLATGVYPGQHGAPGWELRDQKCCEFPCEASACTAPVQIRVLHAEVSDMRRNDGSGADIRESGFTDLQEDVFFAKPWMGARGEKARQTAVAPANKPRLLVYLNAYNGTDFTNWFEGIRSEGLCCPEADASEADANATIIEKLNETALDTLKTSEGPELAIKYFGEAVDMALKNLHELHVRGESTFTYIYTAHPDKHMHQLGVEHGSVGEIVRGLDREIARLWQGVQGMMGAKGTKRRDVGDAGPPAGSRAAMMVTADHGHVTVRPEDMVVLPDELTRMLDYANCGATGKGRHAYLHAKPGLASRVARRWGTIPELHDNFLLLRVDDADAAGLFGPEREVDVRVRPRLGDFVVVALGAKTIITPGEEVKLKHAGVTVGAHGSLTKAEMQIPYVMVKC